MHSNTVRLGLASTFGVIVLTLAACTARSEAEHVAPSTGVAAEASPTLTVTAGPQSVPHPVTHGKTLGSYASAATPGESSLSGRGFDANGAGLDFDINCQGAGTITVQVTGASGHAEAGISSFTVPCEAGKLTSMGNRDHTPHGITSVSVSAPATVAWAMTVGAVPAGETPPA